MNRIDTCFGSRKKIFIPYITAGFPDSETTERLLDLLVAAGADLIELGYPFSDPTADGPVIQASSKAALDGGFRRRDYFRLLAGFRQRHPTVPVVVFSYYNPVFSAGATSFVEEVGIAGADGMLLVDLPFEEQGEVRGTLDAHGMELIQLIAPTTPEARARQILAAAAGFVYQIAFRGVTGMRADLSDESAAMVRRTKAMTSLPVALGFGVSSGPQAAAVAASADGVIVGSALVNTVLQAPDSYETPFRALAEELSQAIHAAG